MTIEQWKSLSEDNKELLLMTVFHNSYVAFTHLNKNPESDTIIQEVLKHTELDGDIAHIIIKKSVRLK